MIQVSAFASAGGVPPAQCHCSQRPELVVEPSSSAKQVDWKLNDFGLNLRRIDVIELAVVLPEARRLGFKRVHRDQELELGQAGGQLLLVRERHQGIEALTEVPVHLALVHELESPQHVVSRNVEFRQIVVSEAVLGRRGRSPHRLLEAHEELLVVLPVTHLVRPQRLEAAASTCTCRTTFRVPSGSSGIPGSGWT